MPTKPPRGFLASPRNLSGDDLARLRKEWRDRASKGGFAIATLEDGVTPILTPAPPDACVAGTAGRVGVLEREPLPSEMPGADWTHHAD